MKEVNVSVNGYQEEGESLFSVGISSIGSPYCDIYTEFGFNSVKQAEEHVREMKDLKIINVVIK